MGRGWRGRGDICLCFKNKQPTSSFCLNDLMILFVWYFSVSVWVRDVIPGTLLYVVMVILLSISMNGFELHIFLH